MRILFQAVLLLALSINTYAINPDIKFSFVTTNMGLSQSTVFAVMQDSRGYVWLGTMDGLNMWDGYTITVFKNNPNDSTSLSHNTITTLAEDDEGNILVGTTGGGLCVFHPETRTFTRHIKLDKEGKAITGCKNIRNIAALKDGIVWMATDEGVARYDRTKGTYKIYKNDPNDPKTVGTNSAWAVYEDSKGRIWASGVGGVISRYNPEQDNFERFTFDNSLIGLNTHDVSGDLLEDENGNIWIGTGHNGVYTFHPDNMNFTHYPVSEDGYGTNVDMITSLDTDNNGLIYIGTDGGGVNIYNPETQEFSYLKYDPKKPFGLTTNAIQSVCIDESGTLMVGTYGGGLCYYNQYRFKFESYTTDPLNKNSLSFKSVLAILEDSDGDIWLGTDGGGLNHFNRSTKDFTHYIHDPNDSTSIPANVIINMFQTRDGEILMGTYSGGLIIYNKEREAFRQYFPDPNNPTGIIDKNVWYVYEDSRGTIWIGYLSNGIAVFDKENETFTSMGISGSGSTSSIFEDSKGLLWIGTQNGLYAYNHDLDSTYHYTSSDNTEGNLSNPSIRKIFEDSQNRLWIGTLDGLNLFERETSTFKTFTTKDGLPNNCINGMIEDNQGLLWASTNQGICKFSLENDKLDVSSFDVSDGLQGNEYNISSQFMSSTGEIYFGGKEGFNVFDPQKIEDNPHEPHVRITDFKIFNKSAGLIDTKVNGNKTQQWVTEADNLRLSYRDNVLAFEFAALDFANPQKNKYEYMLEGFDEDWIETDASKRFATYTNLPGGKYFFKVRGSNNDGKMNKEGTTFKLTIVPPIWKRVWFWVLVIIIVTYLVVKYVKDREEHLKRDKEILESKIQEGLKVVEEQKTEVARTEEELKQRVANEHKQRWYNQGMAKFSQVLSEHKDDLHALSNSILNFIVEYTEVAQGALYLSVIEEGAEPYLELVSGYALDEKRITNQKIKVGEEQVGIAYKTQEIIQLDNLPETYARIESGLGNSPLKHLLIVPLKMNEDSIGVVELISFQALEEYQINFLQKLGETLTSMLTALRANEQTNKLLEQSKQQAEEMSAHEEELRQNLEEMQATQEEAAKREEELTRVTAKFQEKEKKYKDEIKSLNKEISKLKEL